MQKTFFTFLLLPSLLFLTSCAPVEPEVIDKTPIVHDPVYTLGNEQADQGVREYLQSKEDFSWQTADDGKNICVFDKLDTDELFPHYLWVHCGEFALRDDVIVELSGISVPTKINYPNEMSYFDIAEFSYEIPGNGTQYLEDIRSIFPDELQDLVIRYDAMGISEKIREVAERELREN